MASIRPFLLPLAVALGASACSSVDLPSLGGSDEPTASTPAWIQPSAENSGAENAQATAQAEVQNSAEGIAGGNPSAGGFDGQTGIVETGFAGSGGWEAEFAERMDRIESATGAIASDVRGLNRQIGTISADTAAQAEQSAAGFAALASLVSEIEAAQAAYAGIEAQIQALNAAVAANAAALANVRTDLRNVSTSVSGSITPAVELGLGTTGGWFKTTLIVTIVGFACVGFILWRWSQRNAPNGR